MPSRTLKPMLSQSAQLSATIPRIGEVVQDQLSLQAAEGTAFWRAFGGNWCDMFQFLDTEAERKVRRWHDRRWHDIYKVRLWERRDR